MHRICTEYANILAVLVKYAKDICEICQKHA